MNTYYLKLNCDAKFRCIYSFDEEVEAVQKELSVIFKNKAIYSYWDGDTKFWVLEISCDADSLDLAIKDIVDKIVAYDGILEVDSIKIDYHEIVDLL